ncbi:MAG: hypothetical protein WBG42_00390 [Cryomorphaceae bacterium]
MNRSASKGIKALSQFTLMLLLLTSCSAQESELTGTYKSDDPNLVKKGWKVVFEGYDGFITGTQLDLKADSTFHMVTCGNILTGEWSHTDDSLYLTYQTNHWKNDSLQEFGLDGKWPELDKGMTDVLEIRGNQLITHWKQEDGFTPYDVLEK